jgi:hypothetical protein
MGASVAIILGGLRALENPASPEAGHAEFFAALLRFRDGEFAARA